MAKNSNNIQNIENSDNVIERKLLLSEFVQCVSI